MNEKLRQYMDSLFADAPETLHTAELKEEMLQNLTDKYNDLIAEGKTEEAAFNIAAASVGDVRALIASMNGEGAGSEALERARKRNALFLSIAVGLYILSIVPLLLMGNEVGLVLMFVIAALATALLIYNGATKPGRSETPDTVVEDFKAWKQEKSDNHRAKGAIQGAMWLLITCLYLLISFMTGAWHITWIIFLFGSAISLIISGIFDLKQ